MAEFVRPFGYSGDEVVFDVPLDVTEITVDMAGGRGGNAGTDNGGFGGRIQCTLAVTPGETLYLRVGGRGVDGNTTAGGVTAGGYYGGGDGGAGVGAGVNAGSGGGASDIRQGGTTDGHRVLVAGGGGGADSAAGSGADEWGGHTLHDETTTPSAAGDGVTNGVSGTGGGGGGWVGGAAGSTAANQGYGKGGSSMAHSTQTSAVTNTPQSAPAHGWIILTYESFLVSPPSNSLIWYFKNTTTIDTGTGIDVREAEDTSGSNDITQSATATHTADNAARWFDPATGNNNNATDSNTTLLRRGWAIPLSELTPTDDRCRVLLPAQTITGYVIVHATRSPSGLTDAITNMTCRMSLWRYNPTTDAGSLIAAATSSGLSWGGLNPTFGTQQFGQCNIVVSDTILERDEILLVQVGLATGTLGNPLTGTTTYIWNLHVGDADDTRIVFAEPLRMICTHSEPCSVSGASDRELVIVRALKTVPGAAAPDRGSLLLQTQKSSSVLAEATKTLQVEHVDTTDAQGVTTRTVEVGHTDATAGTGLSDRELVIVAATRTAEAVGESTTSRFWEAYREAMVDARAQASRSATVGTFHDAGGLGTTTFDRFWEAFRPRDVAGPAMAVKTVGVLVDAASVATGEATFDRYWEAVRHLFADGTGETSFDRTVIFVRSASVTGVGEIDPNQARICLPIEDLPAAGDGGTVNIRKIFPIFD